MMSIAPMPMITHAHSGVAGDGSDVATGKGADSVMKLNVALGSLGDGFKAMTCQ